MSVQLTPDLRASRSDREETTDRLGTAYAEGRLGSEEFRQRVGRALAARTQGELGALLADLPQPETVAAPPERPEPAWKAIVHCLCCWR